MNFDKRTARMSCVDKQLAKNPHMMFQTLDAKASVLKMFSGAQYPNLVAECVAGIGIHYGNMRQAVRKTREDMRAAIIGDAQFSEADKNAIQQLFRNTRYFGWRSTRYLFSNKLAYYDLSSPRAANRVRKINAQFDEAISFMHQCEQDGIEMTVYETAWWNSTMEHVRTEKVIFDSGIFLIAEEHLMRDLIFLVKSKEARLGQELAKVTERKEVKTSQAEPLCLVS